MLYRSLAAALVVCVVGGIVLAETYRGTITKYSKDELTITVRKEKGKDAKTEEKTIKVGKDVKVQKSAGKDKDAEKASAEDITKGIEGAKGKVKGVFATVKTSGEGDKETVDEITITPAGKGGKKKEKKDN